VSRVTVVVPVYNYGHFLGEALDSVLAQTMSDWECIVVDDGSTDGTAEVARRYAERDLRIRYVRQENRGPSAARNTALRLTSSPYVQLLDADDRLAPSKLEIHSSFLDAHPDVDLVYSVATFFRTEEPERVLYSLHGQLSRPMMQKVYGNRDALDGLQQFNITPPVAMLFRRAVLDRAGYFNEATRACEDWDLWLRCAIAGCEFRYLETSETVGFMRTHSGSASRSSEWMIRGLMDAAETFHQTSAAAHWKRPELPAVYEMASGIAAVERGERLAGVRRLRRAARAATAALTSARWTIYAAAACVLPRRIFMWVVTRPMPERGLELVRRLRGRK
jgi:glycosyltransferase involved in cell wall biosynthesis